MKTLATLIASCFDLFEAEGRSLRTALFYLVTALMLVAVAFAICVAGLAFILWAGYVWLAVLINPPAAALIVGIIVLAIGGALIWIAKRLTR